MRDNVRVIDVAITWSFNITVLMILGGEQDVWVDEMTTPHIWRNDKRIRKAK